MESSAALGPDPRLPPVPRPRRLDPASLAGALIFLAIAAGALTIAKWSPYGHKLAHLWSTRTWTGSDVLAKAGPAGAAPSLSGAWAFTRAYFDSVWKALVAAVLIGAALQALIPQRRLLGLLARRSDWGSALAGGLLALPSLMCTCCTAPVAASLRRRGASTSATLAYWTGNPVLNPAVLAFLAIVAPWQWVLTRILVGLLLVFGVTTLVARWAAGRGAQLPRPAAPAEAFELRAAPAAFVRSLARLCLTLLPEYLLVVFLLGLFRGWLFPLGADAAHWAFLATLAAVVLGTLVVIPTAGEIPILLALSAAGVGRGTVGALLITLPAISLASMAMVARALGARATLAMAGGVAACGLLGGGLLAILGG